MRNSRKKVGTTIVILLMSSGILSLLTRGQGTQKIQRRDQHYYLNLEELVVTEDGSVIDRLSCERIDLSYPDAPSTHQVGTHIGKTRDGYLYILVSSGEAFKMFRSGDKGRSWDDWKVNWPEGGLYQFAVLKDDSFLGLAGGGDRPVHIYLSIDYGRNWSEISQVSAVSSPFETLYGDGDLVELQDGTLLLPIHLTIDPPPGLRGESWWYSTEAQYMYRSSDGGRSWQGGGDKQFWKSLKEADLRIEGTWLQSRIPGEGGTFPGCWETQVLQRKDGKLMAAFRYSGAPQPWHQQQAEEWGVAGAREELAPVVPGLAGDIRIFKYIFLGDSTDGGKSWMNLRPVVDQRGQFVLKYGSLHGELLEIPSELLVLIHVRRYPREDQQVLGRISRDGGETWLRKAYRLAYGSGYPRSVLLDDGTIVTVTGTTLTTPGGPPPPGGHFTGQVIRWRPE